MNTVISVVSISYDFNLTMAYFGWDITIKTQFLENKTELLIKTKQNA